MKIIHKYTQSCMFYLIDRDDGNKTFEKKQRFAKLAHLKETTIRSWLGGTHNFTLKTIAQISTLLNIDLIKVY